MLAGWLAGLHHVKFVLMSAISLWAATLIPGCSCLILVLFLGDLAMCVQQSLHFYDVNCQKKNVASVLIRSSGGKHVFTFLFGGGGGVSLKSLILEVNSCNTIALEVVWMAACISSLTNGTNKCTFHHCGMLC